MLIATEVARCLQEARHDQCLFELHFALEMGLESTIKNLSLSFTHADVIRIDRL